MEPWINYHHLYYFKTIAEEGTVSKAAAKLRLGQPTLSAQLKQLEENLGVQLFERRHKKLLITEHGKIALDYAQNIFRIGSEMFEVINDRLAPNRISFHVGALDSIAKQIVVSLVENALRFAPCQISLSEGRLDALVRELVAHRMDVLLTNFLPTNLEARGLTHRRIARDTICIYGSPKFRKLRRNFPRSIAGQPLILPNYDSRLRYDLDQWFRSEEISFDVVTEGQDIAVKKLLAIDGLGLIPAAEHTVQRQILAGELVKIGALNGVFEELFLISAQRRMENPVAQHVMKKFRI